MNFYQNTLKRFLFFALLTAFFASCRESHSDAGQTLVSDSTRIVSLNGTVSEVIAALGFEDRLVGTDVASTYPATLRALPKVGHGKKIAPEGVLALHPDLVLGVRQDVSPALEEQLRGAGVRLLLFDQDFSVEGAKRLISGIADSLGYTAKGDSVVQLLDQQVKEAEALASQGEPKVLFIYARGTGTMMVGGEGTQAEEIIRLAGGRNAVSGFEDFKPVTPEALVAANPDAILLFSSGLESLGGPDGLLSVQGVPETEAGKNKRFIAMDGQLLTGFGPRLGAAIRELKEKIHP